MVNKNIQMRKFQDGDWDNLFPLTLMENVLNSEGDDLNKVFMGFQENIEQNLDNVKNLKDWELNSWNREKKPIILFHSDDGHIADWTHAKPIFDHHDVPLTISVGTDFIGQENYLSMEQLQELQSKGWEISSHGLDHTSFRSLSLNEVERQLSESKRYLEENGLTVENVAYPHGSYNYDILKIAKKYYRSGRIISRGMNNFPLTTQALRTVWISSRQDHQDDKGNDVNTLNYYKNYIDEVVRSGSVGIISFHSKDILQTNDYSQLLSDVVAYAKQQTKIMTYNEMLNNVGNIIDIGVYNPAGVGGDNDYFVVGVNGKVQSSGFEYDYNLLTTPHDIPIGITSSRIMSDDPSLNQAPLNSMGLLVSYKGSRLTGGQGYIFQEYRLFESNIVYKRYGSDYKWTDWVRSELITIDNERTPYSPYNYFRAGITLTIVDSNNEGLLNAPHGKRGLMITYSPADGSRIGYSRQEYIIAESNEKYARYYTEEGWGGWYKTDPITTSDKNDLDLSNGIARYDNGISYKVVTGDDEHIALTPNGKRGTLTTHKIRNDNSQIGYNYQEFLEIETNTKYIRYPASTTSWNEWQVLNS